jgi:hypothetical protein
MVKFENDCCDCGLPCSGSCNLRNVPHFYCDGCNEEVDALYDYDGGQYCKHCLLQIVPKVEVVNE